MRFLLFTYFSFLCLLLKLSQAFDDKINENSVEVWNDLLRWFRTLNRTARHNENYDFQNYSGEESETLDDEAELDLRENDPENDWIHLTYSQQPDFSSETKILNAVPENEEEESGPIRGASLAFVFDSTGSMGNELMQVKAGATQILAAMRDHPDAPIYNYIWVPFKDPVIGPVTVTTDHKLFQERMSAVVAFGGGDCPEVSIGAVKKALQASLPNSYIYVFTDAYAKDYKLLNDVLSLVQQKQAQVVFILTGECQKWEGSYSVYERIAEASSGQIYKLSSEHVKDVLKYVKVALQPHVVSLLSLNKPAPDKTNPDKVEVVIDDSIKQFTVSVSGLNATINVTDPKGVRVNGPPKLEQVLNLTNIKVVNVKEPDPGAWKFIIDSDSDYSVRSTGLSKINFNHGFSTLETINLKETNYRPLKGAKSFLLVQTSDLDQIFNITNLDFVGLDGEILKRLDLVPATEKEGLYKAGMFYPPDDFFYLGVSGYGKDGLPIKRLTATAISPQLPERPLISADTKVVGKINDSGTIKCYIQSVVPFTIRWYKNGVFLGKEQNCSETCEAFLSFERFTLQNEGNYSCSAKNLAGSDSKTVKLFLLGDAPSVTVKSPVVALLGHRVHLDCLVESKMPFVVKWKQFTTKDRYSGVLHPSSTGKTLKNNTLLIESVTAADEGWYVCIATNKGGESQGRILLIIKEPLLVKVHPKSLTYSKGDSVRLSCSATGKPQPRLKWMKDDEPVKSSSFITEKVGGNVNLVIDYLNKGHAGIYVCTAINPEESASASTELIYTEDPTIKAKENNIIVKKGAEVVMECFATGAPKPTIQWFKGDQELFDFNKFQIENNILKIKSIELLDSGEYSCKASNDGGSAVDHIGVTVGSAPSFVQNPRDKKIQIDHTGTIPCSVFGIPLPEIKWTRLDGRELDTTRMSVLPTGALKILRMKYDDSGQYICSAENVFGTISSKISVKVTGTQKPVPDQNMELKDLEAVSGSEIVIPCGIMLGNPPATVKWFKNDMALESNNEYRIKNTGELVIKNATAENRGNYICLAENVLGNTSRTYEVIISESPNIKETKEKELKGKIGGEIIIPCPAEGFPLPTLIWTRNGQPLPMSSTIFQDEKGSLIIKNLTEANSGVYKCTAINAVGSASKATVIQVQVPPKFPNESHDSLINVVEGHVVMLNCNVSATPKPKITWYKNDEVYVPDGEQSIILRFVASIDDTGIFKCVAENDAGKAEKEFNVTILVPPKILGWHNEESIKAKAGVPITLLCNVIGVPVPTILWQRNGMYLTQNSSDITISDSGSLTITNVTKESAGAYTCDAENLGGITQRTYYLQVKYPPKIVQHYQNTNITLKEGEEYSLACLVEGNPKPSVLWRKNGLPIYGHHDSIIVLDDNTLVFLQVTREASGTYKCEAISSEGSAFQEFEISVLIPPILAPDFYPTKLEVNEGDSLALTCPTTQSVPPANIQWIKNGAPLDLFLQERSDEAQIKLSVNQRTLTIKEAHPSDKGNYSCVATNLAGRTDARFLVDVLMTPYFEEFNHVAHRTILTGGEVILNCSVSGNPMPKITWRKENVSVTPYNIPGVHISLDKQHLMITNGQVHHSGTYICLATNKVNTKEREFYVTVLQPPQISGPLQETIDIMKGENITLKCEADGVPFPTFSWIKEEDSKQMLNVFTKNLELYNVECEDSGVYLCEVTNTAGTRTKHFEVNVLESPHVENQEIVENVEGVIGGNITMKCKTSGHPKPETSWLHNGNVLNKVKKRSLLGEHDNYINDWYSTDEGSYASLTLTNVHEGNRGTYTLLAFNKAGVVEKQFQVHILVPPKLLPGRKSKELLTVIQSLPVSLKCPVEGNPTPQILWFKKDGEKQLNKSVDLSVIGNQLMIKRSHPTDSGSYICLAENSGGRLEHEFFLDVIGPPIIDGTKNQSVDSRANDTVILHCNISNPENVKYSWYHSSSRLINSSELFITENGRSLIIPNVQPKKAGMYSCLATNMAGSSEIVFHVEIHEPPEPSDESLAKNHKIVFLHHPFFLYCSFTGHPLPSITWYKDGEIFLENNNYSSMSLDNSYLRFSSSKPEDAGHYKCVGKNRAGIRELNFTVDIIVRAEWSHWSDWSSCSVTCGFGEQTRRRQCNLENANVGLLRVDKTRCLGETTNKKICFTECPSNGGWANWESWSPCSKTCGKGSRIRKRVCESSSLENYEKNCKGNEMEEEICNEKDCPIDGQWSEWSEWSVCSDSCGGGITQRIRKCNSPFPQNGGKDCLGWGSELKVCNREKCQEVETWSPWSEWSPCSATCGKGHKKRNRKCRISKTKRICKGENFQLEKCFVRSCHNSKFPSSANLRVKGKLNGDRIDRKINVNIDNLENEVLISGDMIDLLERKKKWFPYAPFLLHPLSWNTAYETDNAENGYSLTEGNFFSQSDIKFATGEDLRMEHRGEGVDENGTLQVEIEVIGEVPLMRPNSSVIIEPLEQDYIQTGSRSLYSFTQNNVTFENEKLPFSWNTSINYDPTKGTMPYLVEKLSLKDIFNSYNPDTQKINFSTSASIGKKYNNNVCPVGFSQNPNLKHCQDINECESYPNPCNEKICENTFGSFKCSCRKGFKMVEGSCLDIDECSLEKVCSHFCYNIPGSYMCSCPYGFYLAPDLRNCLEIYEGSGDVFYGEENNIERSTLKNSSSVENYFDSEDSGSYQEYKAFSGVACPSGYFLLNNECHDYNECKDSPKICDIDETCINLPGSYQCLSIPCSEGYERTRNKNCVKKCMPNNKCKSGARFSESVVFYPVVINFSNVLPLDKLGEPLCNVERISYNITESKELFQVKVSQNRSFLIPKKKLNKDTLYRVKVEASSYDLTGLLLYFTEFIVFLIVR